MSSRAIAKAVLFVGVLLLSETTSVLHFSCGEHWSMLRLDGCARNISYSAVLIHKIKIEVYLCL